MGIFVITKTIWKKDLSSLVLARAREGTTSIHLFYEIHQNNIVFCCCCCCCSRLSCCLGTVSLSLLVNLPALCIVPVSRVWCVFHVSWRLRCFCCLFLLIIFVDPDARVVGDQGLDFAQSAWGFLSRNGFLFVLTYMRHGYWSPCDDNCHREVSFVVILTMLLRHFCRVCRQGRHVASRQIVTMASLVAFELFSLQGSGVSCWEWRR